MHQDTQNFSVVTDIETVHALKVEIEYKTHGNCIAYVMLNDYRIHHPNAMISVNLFDPIQLRINLLEFTEGNSGLEIVKFAVNGLEILPKYRHLANKSTTYIDTYDEYVLEIPSPFYTWYHEISGQGWIA
jgi:hypothetical protein